MGNTKKTVLEIVVRVLSETIEEGRGYWTISEERVVVGNELHGDGTNVMAPMPLPDARAVADRVTRNKEFLDASLFALTKATSKPC